MSIIFAILMFSVLIFVHELGHFMTAKFFDVQVNEFSMFMGPALWKKQIGETLYSIRLIPFGGYCAMEGEDEDTDNPRSFQKAAWWKRIIILAAGSVMNEPSSGAMQRTDIHHAAGVPPPKAAPFLRVFSAKR